MADTPLMIQYREMKKQYRDMVLFFRLGDFYEMFDEDAVEVSSLLNLTLTHKGDSPMCGIPYHAVKNYLKRLLDAGKKIAICEQLSLSESPKALAKREVVRIVTPATVVDEDLLDEKSFSYILSVFRHSCSFCDVTTGDFRLRELSSKSRISDLKSIISQINPKEILVCEDEYFQDSELKDAVDQSFAMCTKLAPWYFNVRESYKLLCEQAEVQSLASYGINENDKIVASAGAMLRYIRETSKSSVSHLTDYKIDSDDQFLLMDESSRKNLELFAGISDNSSRFSLFNTINRCRTSSGVRLLKNWLSFPLRNLEEIELRQKWVKFFYTNQSERERIRNSISSSLDLNRLTTRILLKRSVPHDLTAVKQSIGTFLDIVSSDPERYFSLFETSLRNPENLKKATDLMVEIDKAVNDQFLGQFNPGEVILNGYDSDLDEKRRLLADRDNVLKSYLEEEKQASGLSILKLGYNRVFGYYLEIPKGQVDRAPDYFFRKQTLVNGERFTTEKLQKFETEILSAGSSVEEREKYLYDSLNGKVLEISGILNSIGHFLSLLDVFQGLATLASDSDYVCPEVVDQDVLEIKDGRHPVVEKQIGHGKFVANSLNMQDRFILITGPNMAGKSTYLRQNALIILLAHIGSFVPASSAKIGLTDKIFCRVGASDNLARGESTFLVEMQEAAYILRNASSRSFVIVDEIGRGTSTQDGLSIAYAMMQKLISLKCKTLFATHYHELTMLDTSEIKLLTLEVEDSNGNVKFIRRIIEGVANSSYGIHVARMAGVPSDVVKEAQKFQRKHFSDYGMVQNELFTSGSDDKEESNSVDLYLADAYRSIIDSIKNTDIDSLTPMQAMILLSNLKDKTQDL